MGILNRICNLYNWSYLICHPKELLPSMIIKRLKSTESRTLLAANLIAVCGNITVEEAKKHIDAILDLSNKGYKIDVYPLIAGPKIGPQK